MYNKRLLWSVLICMALLVSFTPSFAATSGQVQGTITDASTQESLPGANVFLKGTAIGSASDLEGQYRIANIPPGNYTLVVSYMGYIQQEVPIQIAANRTLTQNIKMDYSVVDVEGEVIITAQREGQVAAINQQITSDQIVNVVSAERIQELPDANAAESIGRLPGIAVQRSGGEAQTLMIRGLDAKYTTISLNGVQIPATASESRSVDLSVLSQETLAGIEVYKAITPDQDADAIAGAVNLITGKAPEGQKIRFDVIGSYNDLEQSASQYDVSGRYSNRFWDGKLGIQAGAQAEKRDRSTESFVDSWNIPADLNYSISSLTVAYTDETRERYGADITFDYNTSDGGNIKFINLFSNTNREQYYSSRNYSTGGDNITYNGRATDSEIQTWNNSLVGENHLFNLDLNWALAHAYTNNSTPFNHAMQFRENQTTNSGMKDDIYEEDYKRVPGKDLIPLAWNNFESGYLRDAEFTHSENDERNLVARIDIKKDYNLGSKVAGFFKFGYKFRNKERNRDYDRRFAPYWLRTSPDSVFTDSGQYVAKDYANSYWPNGSSNLLVDCLTGPPYTSRTMYDDYLLNPLINGSMVREWYNLNGRGIKNNYSATGVSHLYEYVYMLESNRNKYHVEEMFNAAYLMTKLNIGQAISIIAGVRYESENNDYSAKFVPEINGFLESQKATIYDTTKTFSNEHWLPNVHVRVKPFKWIDFRFAYTQSLTRPDFQMRLPNLYVNHEAGIIERGNPGLEPALADNFDLSMSLYKSEYGLLTVSGFYKKIDNVFYWLNNVMILNKAHADSIGLPEEFGPYNQMEMSEPVSVDDTDVYGYEIDLQTHMWFLPGILQNIVINANFSKIWSHTKYPRFTMIQPDGFPPPAPIPTYYYTERALTGQTDYTGNIAVGYDQGGFSTRLSVYFQGPYLASISSAERADQYRKSFSRWDLSIKQQVTQNIAVFANINNLTNTVEGNYYTFREIDRGGEVTGVSGDLGLRFTF